MVDADTGVTVYDRMAPHMLFCFAESRRVEPFVMTPNETCKSATVRSKISAIRHHYHLAGYELPSDPRLSLWYSGAEQTEPHASPSVPVTVKYLPILYLLCMCYDYGHIVFGAMVVAWAMMLRVSEYTFTKGGHHLRKRDVRVTGQDGQPLEFPYPDEQVKQVTVTFPSSKTERKRDSRGGGGVTRIVPRIDQPFNGRFCPQRQILAALRRTDGNGSPGEPDDPLFAIPATTDTGRPRPLQPHHIGKPLEALGRHLGVDPKTFTSHGFRSGGATDWAANGATHEAIATLGRWAWQEFYHTYIWLLAHVTGAADMTADSTPLTRSRTL